MNPILMLFKLDVAAAHFGRGITLGVAGDLNFLKTEFVLCGSQTLPKTNQVSSVPFGINFSHLYNMNPILMLFKLDLGAAYFGRRRRTEGEVGKKVNLNWSFPTCTLSE